MNCPSCACPDLDCGICFELPADARSDEISFRLARCQCGWRGVDVYEESRRGALDNESWDSYCFTLRVGIFESLQAAIARCPAPQDRRCSCRTHAALSITDAAGRWIGLEPLRGG